MTQHNNTIYLRHIIDSIDKITNYLHGLSFDDLSNNGMVVDAVLRNLEIIGEASNNISDEFKESHPEIDFRSAIGIRNRLIHGYDDVNLEIVWKTSQEDLPFIKTAIEAVLNDE